MIKWHWQLCSSPRISVSDFELVFISYYIGKLCATRYDSSPYTYTTVHVHTNGEERLLSCTTPKVAMHSFTRLLIDLLVCIILVLSGFIGTAILQIFPDYGTPWLKCSHGEEQARQKWRIILNSSLCEMGIDNGFMIIDSIPLYL